MQFIGGNGRRTLKSRIPTGPALCCSKSFKNPGLSGAVMSGGALHKRHVRKKVVSQILAIPSQRRRNIS